MLARLDPAIGTWAATGTHPHMPGSIVRGRFVFERIERGAFVRMRSKMDDPRFPEGVAIFGTDDETGAGSMLYFDDRGISRKYDVELRADGFTWSRDAASFAQSFRTTFGKDGRTMESEGKMRREGKEWEPDLALRYERM